MFVGWQRLPRLGQEGHTMTTIVCAHGSLQRSCEVCDLQAEVELLKALLARCPEAVKLALTYIESRLDDSYWNRMVALQADLRAALGEGGQG